MYFSLLLVTGLTTVATALPQRPGGGRGQLRGGQNSDQNAQGGGAGLQATDLSGFQFPQGGSRPPPIMPGNTQGGNQGATNEGHLNNEENAPTANPGNANEGELNAPDNSQGGVGNQGSGNIGNVGQNPNGQQSGQNQSGQNGQGPDGQNQNEQNQNGGSQNAGNQTGAFDASLVPEFGVEAGVSPDGQGNCLGLNNVKIPCSCPPNRQNFIQKVQAAAAAGNSEGVPVKFPLDDSSASKKARIQTSIVVLQNLKGKGVGCPAAATTFLAQQAAA